jgi:hypothetical protein
MAVAAVLNNESSSHFFSDDFSISVFALCIALWSFDMFISQSKYTDIRRSLVCFGIAFLAYFSSCRWCLSVRNYVVINWYYAMGYHGNFKMAGIKNTSRQGDPLDAVGLG